MKVTIKRDEKLESNELIINCKNHDENIIRVKSYAENIDFQIEVKREHEILLISPYDVYYMESVDKRVFLYLDNEVFECSLRLYELEERYKNLSFFRASKSSILNAKYIKKVIPQLNRNLLVTLKNDEKQIVSRRYVNGFKKMIGME